MVGRKFNVYKNEEYAKIQAEIDEQYIAEEI